MVPAGDDSERVSFHDCHIYRVELRAGDPELQNWTSDLALDIDFIVEWICGPGAKCEFRVAPADLIFHQVTDLRMNIEWSRSGFQNSIHPMSIEAVEQKPVKEQKVCLDRPYYSWTIHLNWPAGGEIAFGAAGFTLTQRAEPILTPRQHLLSSERNPRAGS
jgi:hypothetical protein